MFSIFIANLPHQNIKTVGVLNRGTSLYSSPLDEHETSNGATRLALKFFSSFRECVLCLFERQGFPARCYFPAAYSLRWDVFTFEQEVHHLLLLQQLAVFGFIMLSFSR